MLNKTEMKKALLKNGFPTAGMSEEELRAAYKRLGKGGDIEQDQEIIAQEPLDTLPDDGESEGEAGNGESEQKQEDRKRQRKQKRQQEQDSEYQHERLDLIVKILTTGNHVYLVGPAGSGKTTLAYHAAERLNRPFFKQGVVILKHELVGFVDAAGNYHGTAFRHAFQYGGVFLADEMDSSSPDAVLAINDALANGSYTFPDSPEPCPRHKDFVCIAAANTVGKGATAEYVGRTPLDAATLDRFVQVTIDYDLEIETKAAIAEFLRLGGGKTKIKLVDAWVSEVRTVREKVLSKGFKVVISPRASMQGAGMLAVGVAPRQIRESVLYKHFSDDQLRQIQSGDK